MLNAELLAPAGSYDAFKAAIKAGCDAVYLGGNRFGARAFAENFSDEELLHVIDEAHIYDKKVYLTVNTLFKENELKELYLFLLPLYKAGLDAVIIQDLGAVKMVRDAFPDMNIHASTQMTVTGYHGAKFLDELGVSRVVPARELSLAEISAIRKHSSIEIECFVHGALCYCYSGQCLLSSFIGGRSGNRGTCAQPCRLPYTVFENGRLLSSDKTSYPLNTKDICTVEILPQLLEAGVYSLKIEGRMKRPEYTAGVVSIYRKYLDLYASGSEYKVEKEDLKFLFDLFNRDGFSRSYYEIHNGPSMMALENKKAGNTAIRNTDLAYKKVADEILIKEPKVNVHADVYAGRKGITLKLKKGNVKATATSGQLDEAKNRGLDEETLIKQLSKTGGTPFSIEFDRIVYEPGLFAPVKVLNDLRRQALANLEDEILKESRREISDDEADELKETKSQNTVACPENVSISSENAQVHDLDTLLWYENITAQVCEKEQLVEVLSHEEVKSVILPYYYFDKFNDGDAVSRILNSGKKPVIALPRVSRNTGRKEYVNFLKTMAEDGCGFLVNSLEDFYLLKEKRITDDIRLESGFYTMNSKSRELMESFGVIKDTIPLELNRKELRWRYNRESELIVYGSVPLMVSAQCVKKNYDRCTKNYDSLVIKDRRGYEFPVKCDCSSCQNIILNSLPISLIAKKEELSELNAEGVRFVFTDEDENRIRNILKAWTDGTLEENFEFTRGHYTRGAK